jgi:ribosome-binding protein aMBF1 (putative translation factor)
LADELQIAPGIISEIERGKYLPGFIVEHYLNIQYNMNLRWFTTGRGKMRRLPGKKSKYSKLAQFISRFNENDPLFKKYPELNFLLHIPVIEQIKKEKEYQAKIYKNKERKTMRNLKENEAFKKIGERLKLFREILGLSREQMADESDNKVDNIEQLEKGEIEIDIFFPYIIGLKRDFGLCLNWLITGNGQPFSFQGPKTPWAVYENYKSTTKTDGNYNVGGVYLNDEQLLMDIINLLRFPEARAVLQGQIIILKNALKSKLKA